MVFVCIEQAENIEPSDNNGNNVTILAVVETIEMARLVCRDRFLQKKDPYFFGDSCSEKDRNKYLESCYKSGQYTKQKCSSKGHRYKIWFDGPFEVYSETNSPRRKLFHSGVKNEDAVVDSKQNTSHNNAIAVEDDSGPASVDTTPHGGGVVGFELLLLLGLLLLLKLALLKLAVDGVVEK
jgi:hypothetical protein